VVPLPPFQVKEDSPKTDCVWANKTIPAAAKTMMVLGIADIAFFMGGWF
jgi:hypothetical protein